jgi:hypothetical protein
MIFEKVQVYDSLVPLFPIGIYCLQVDMGKSREKCKRCAPHQLIMMSELKYCASTFSFSVSVLFRFYELSGAIKNLLSGSAYEAS